MKKERRSALVARARGVRDRIERWRQTRDRLGRMPEDLWEAAVALARTHGVYATSQVLRVDYGTLRHRVCGAVSDGRDGEARSGGFVELSAARLVGTAGQPPTVVELSDIDGSRLMIRLGGCDRLDVAGLADAFWRRRA